MGVELKEPTLKIWVLILAVLDIECLRVVNGH